MHPNPITSKIRRDSIAKLYGRMRIRLLSASEKDLAFPHSRTPDGNLTHD
jgi:hypothetical protein